MSGMSSVSAAGAQYSAASTSASSVRKQMDPSEMADRMEADLNEKLTAAGVSEEVREAIQTDIRAAMESEMSSESRPDPEAMKETIDGIFAEYGMNAEEFMQGPPPGGGPGGPPPGGGPGGPPPGGGPGGPPPGGGPGGPGGTGGTDGTSDTKADALQELLEELQESLEDEESDTDASTLLDQFSEQVMDLLFGFDEEA